MYNSIAFKIYCVHDNERRLLENAFVEHISYNANEFNTASFSVIVNSIEEEPLPVVGDRVLIYAYGKRIAGNDFSKNFLNKNLEQYIEYSNNNSFDDYELLVFAGEIVLVNSQLEANMFADHFVFKYEFDCVGIEHILVHLLIDKYLFYDHMRSLIVEVDGTPFFDKNCYKGGSQRAFTINGHGDFWTKADLLQYAMNTITSPFSDLTISIEYTPDTLNDLLSLPQRDVKLMNYKQLLDAVCGQLFNYYFTYSVEENIFTLHIRIISHASNDDVVSFLNLHGTSINGVEQKPVDKVVITYPLMIPIEGIFKIYRNKDNIDNEPLYTLTDSDIEYCKAVHGEEAVIDEIYLDEELLLLYYQLGFNALVPERVDECLRNSTGYRLGTHRKFYLYPIFEATIGNANCLMNLEEFEILKLNAFLRVHNGTPLLWASKRPFSDITITVEGNQVDIESDIPHQIAPTGYSYPHSMIELPVFPINDGDEIYLQCLAKSTITHKYASAGSGLTKKIIDIDIPLDDTFAAVLANHLLAFYSTPIQSFTLNGVMLDWLIDYIFCFAKKIKNLFFIVFAENEQNPFENIVNINLLAKNFSINRAGSIYTFSLNADISNVGTDEIINSIVGANKVPFQKDNAITIKGNIDGIFSGMIKEVKYNHYIVLPEWAEDENDTIDVARVDELKLGYWANNPPSEDISFEIVWKDGGEADPSRRIEVIKKNGIEQERIENAIVPSETLYPIINFKFSSGKILTIKRLSISPPDFRFLKAIDVNTYSRTFAELLE